MRGSNNKAAPPVGGAEDPHEDGTGVGRDQEAHAGTEDGLGAQNDAGLVDDERSWRSDRCHLIYQKKELTVCSPAFSSPAISGRSLNKAMTTEKSTMKQVPKRRPKERLPAPPNPKASPLAAVLPKKK